MIVKAICSFLFICKPFLFVFNVFKVLRMYTTFLSEEFLALGIDPLTIHMLHHFPVALGPL